MSKQVSKTVVKYKPLFADSSSAFKMERSLDTITFSGSYLVEIDHNDTDVGLPFEYCNENHYIVGTLVVTDSGTGGPIQSNRVIGQVLTLTSRKEKETKVYSRTRVDDKWSEWHSLVLAGMYDNISNTDELVATVAGLVDETKKLTVAVGNSTAMVDNIKKQAVQTNSLYVSPDIAEIKVGYRNIDNSDVAEALLPAATATTAGIMAAEDKRVLEATASRLGFHDETITLASADLLPMTWNGTKMVGSTNYHTWIIPLYKGRRYKCIDTPFIQSMRVCNKRPVLGENIAMAAAIGLETGTFTATEDTRYLVITVFMAEPNTGNLKAYDGSSYEVLAFKSGLIEGVVKIEDNLEKVTAGLENSDNITKRLAREVNACLGTKDRTIVLTSDDFDNVLWNGTSFAKANSTYNGFVVPIYPGERIIYIDNKGANNVCTLTEYPTVGSSSRLRTRTELNGNFIVQDNEHYLFLNATVSIFTSYKVIADDGSASERIDALKRRQSPLYGKTIVCFGDSITEFNDSEGKGWSDYLATMSGANVISAGIGGTQLATRKAVVETPTDYLEAYGAVDISNLVKAWATKDWTAVDNAVAWLASNKNDDNSMQIERLKATPIENVDIVIVFGGTNDCANGTFGSPNDTNPIQNTCGGINQIIDSILSVKPDIAIYFFTPIPRMVNDIWCDDYRTDQSDAHGSLSFPSLVKRIKECVEYNHIPCCDMFNAIGINRKNLLTYAPDGVHPKNGYSLVANRIYGFIQANRIWQ